MQHAQRRTLSLDVLAPHRAINGANFVGELYWHRSQYSQNQPALSCSWPSVGTGRRGRFMALDSGAHSLAGQAAIYWG